MLVENHLWYRLDICEANDIERRSREMTTAGVAYKNRRCSFSCEPVKKGESVRRLKLIQQTINDHQQNMYVVLNIQS